MDLTIRFLYLEVENILL